MESFLKTVCRDVLLHTGGQLRDVCIITPNRRSGLFLRRHFIELSVAGTWLPEFTTLDEFTTRLSGRVKTGPVELLLEFYKAYIAVEGSQADGFERFMDWAPDVITEFNDVDMALADAQALFTYLSEAKAIELWHPNKPELTAGEQRYLAFYKSLSRYYTALSAHLEEQKMAYSGMIYRYVAENIESIVAAKKWPLLVFAGFNALTPSETTILKHFKTECNALFFWDADTFYLNDSQHEAGTFLRRNAIWCRPFTYVEEHFKTGQKNIRIIGTPRRINQAEQAGRVIESIDPSELENTCLVLANEELLLPALYSIPESCGAFNITMSYPLRLSQVGTFINNLFEMHVRSHRLSAAKGRFYHRDVFSLLMHPLLANLLKADIRSSQELLSPFIESRQIAKVLERLSPENTKRILPLFTAGMNGIELTESLLTFLDAGEAYTASEEFEQGIVQQAIPEIRRLLHSLKASGIQPGVETAGKLIHYSLRSTGLPFYGEPLQGLQIMGMLETRTLDFKNLIIAGVNENVLPAASRHSSIIPSDIRNTFSLINPHDKDAVYAYNFYRLLQRAENIWLIYNTAGEGGSPAEPSRYIHQLLFELPTFNPSVLITESVVSAAVQAKHLTPAAIRIEKSPEILASLHKYALERGFSPTALHHFSECSLRFYFTYVEKLYALEEIEEEPDAKGIGSMVHEALQHLLEPLLNKPLSAAELREAKEKAATACLTAWENVYPGIEAESGNNLLSLTIVVKMVQNHLEKEAEFIEEGNSILIKGFEIPLKYLLSTPSGQQVMLNGRIDKAEIRNGVYTLSDYKTGRAGNMQLSLEDEFLTDTSKKIENQLAIYTLLALRNGLAGSYDLNAECVKIRELDEQTIALKISPELPPAELADAIETSLAGFFEQIFDSETAFEQTPEEEKCTWCAFQLICSRHIKAPDF